MCIFVPTTVVTASYRSTARDFSFHFNLNRMQNKLSNQITAESLQQVMNAATAVEAALPFLISLTPAERAAGLRLGDKSYALVEKVRTYMLQQPTLTPNYIDQAEFEKDFALFTDLINIQRRFQPLMDKINDTLAEAGMESVGTALSYYHYLKGAAKQGVPGAEAIYSDLKPRFTSGGRPAKTPEGE